MTFELIEASAGTGKTYSITSRYLLLLLEQQLLVSEILVVTFTEAATAELRDRIRVRVRETRDAIASRSLDTLEDKDLVARLLVLRETDEDLRLAEKRLANALASFDEAAIFTIHGFCRRVLREEAFSSGMDFSAEVLTDDLPILQSVTADFARTYLPGVSAEEYGWCVASSPFFDGASESDWTVTGTVMKPKSLRTLRKIISNPLLRVVPEPVTLGQARQANDPEAVALAVTHDLIAYAKTQFARRKRELRVLSFDDMLLHVYMALTGPGGGRLAETLHDTFRAALIDEFQDTDPLQYTIIREIYRGTNCPVVFVGDPKQAIYSFRSGDIFAYFSATAAIPAANRTTLPVNYRSARDLVTAVTKIFTYRESKHPFFDGGKTGYPIVSARHESGKDPVQLPPIPGRAAFHWFILPESPPPVSRRGNTAYGWPKPRAQEMAVNAVVDEIALLVPNPDPSPGKISHGDIAVLVPTHRHATMVQTALREADIPSIIKSMGNVFESESAAELLTLLRAVVSPGNESFLSAALISGSIGHTAAGLVAIKNDTVAYARAAEPFLRLRETWQNVQNGFIRMAMQLLYNRGMAADGKSIAEHLLVYTDAERRLTDMLHLIELLHQESILHPGPDHLLRWLEEQKADASGELEEASIRLESDAKRVQIVTIHSSKGLEYPVVFCPFIFEGKETNREKGGGSVVFFHEDQAGATAADEMPALTADIGSPDWETHFQKTKQEAWSESIRLLYVALTRARQRCYVVWGQVNKMQQAALSWLLFGDRTRKETPIKELSYQDIVRPVNELQRACGRAMSVSRLGPESAEAAPAPPRQHTSAGPAYGPRQFDRGPVRPSWSFASYTSLTSEWSTSGRDVDAVTEGTVIVPAEEWSIFSFPAGARTGKMWHQLFERLNFQSTGEQIDAFAAAMLRRHGYPSGFAPALSTMVSTTLAAPLGPPGIRLQTIRDQSSVRELDFVYSVDRFRVEQVRRILEDPAYGLPRTFHAAATRLNDRDIRGFMIGTIDLLAEAGGRYYLLDYKSNHLGNAVGSYAPPLLTGVMADGHYYLQYLIYTIAVHRYLQTRIPDYTYETHFGGVFYLFLRGIEGESQSGIFFDRPSFALIQALEACLTKGGKG